MHFERYEWDIMKAIFNNFFFTFRGFWKISNDIFKKVVEQRYMHDKMYSKTVHIEIANALEKTPNSIRMLEEKTNHLYKAEDWGNLKHTLSLIETFLLLFNPFTKYDLCRYWQVLGDKGFDPVDQYNSGLEQWDMHYSPKEEELFTIILQISRFLKEFTDFETKSTPVFSHPFVKGKITQFKATNPLMDTDEDSHEAPKHKQSKEMAKQESMPNVHQSKKTHKESSVISQTGQNNTEQIPCFIDDDVEVSDCDDTTGSECQDSNKLNYLEDIGLYNE